jgi:hypothetical protein
MPHVCAEREPLLLRVDVSSQDVHTQHGMRQIARRRVDRYSCGRADIASVRQIAAVTYLKGGYSRGKGDIGAVRQI